jgi:hypothetical protein
MRRDGSSEGFVEARLSQRGFGDLVCIVAFDVLPARRLIIRAFVAFLVATRHPGASGGLRSKFGGNLLPATSYEADTEEDTRGETA